MAKPRQNLMWVYFNIGFKKKGLNDMMLDLNGWWSKVIMNNYLPFLGVTFGNKLSIH